MYPHPYSPSSTKQSGRHNGKVARLPQHLRDLINTMLRDGTTYDAIIAKLREHGVSLIPSNLSRWRKGGHQDWLKERLWLEEMGSRLEFVMDQLRKNEGDRLPKAPMELASLRIFEFLMHFDPTPAHTGTADDRPTFLRTVNALCRLIEKTGLPKIPRPF
jgi:hypothetical protein